MFKRKQGKIEKSTKHTAENIEESKRDAKNVFEDNE